MATLWCNNRTKYRIYSGVVGSDCETLHQMLQLGQDEMEHYKTKQSQ